MRERGSDGEREGERRGKDIEREREAYLSLSRPDEGRLSPPDRLTSHDAPGAGLRGSDLWRVLSLLRTERKKSRSQMKDVGRINI